MIPAFPCSKSGFALQAILFALIVALFTLPGAFVVSGCGDNGVAALTQDQKDKVDELTAGKTEEEKKEMLKNLTEDQKKDLGLNPDQLNQLIQFQDDGISGSDPKSAVGGGVPPVVVPPVVVPPDPDPIPPGGPGPIPPGGPGPLPPGGPGPLPCVP